jgi:tetratricopeptide (TPR) repeat protein
MNCFVTWRRLALPLMLSVAFRALASDGTNAPAPVPAPEPVSARDFYNAGTRLLATKQFADAERMFESSLAAQDDRLQPPAMYNLGHTRFADGADLLKKGPDAEKVSARGRAALAEGDHAVDRAETALANNQMDSMINAYIEGRGARHDLREAEKALQAAMETYGKTMQKWQRSVDDFKGAAELNPADTNATENAEKVERALAKLVDSLRQMEGLMGAMDQKRQDLGKELSKLKGRIPAPNAPPGSGGEDEDDEKGITPDALAGEKEGPSQQGDQMEMQLTPEQAGQILDGLSLDGSRRLSMSDQQGKPPGDRKGRNW